MLENLKVSYAKKSKQSLFFVDRLCNEIKATLIAEGMEETDRRFYPYLTTRLRKKLKINERNILFKRFRDFLSDQNELKEQTNAQTKGVVLP